MRLWFLVVMLAGCADMVVTPLRMPLGLERLLPDGPPIGGAVSMVVEPVDLARFVNRARFPDGTRALVAARVVTTPPVDGKWAVPPDIEPTLVGRASRPRFSARTVPLLPYGSFWIEITNGETAAIFLSPAQLTLALGPRRFTAIADDEAAAKLWSATLVAYPRARLGSPWIDDELQAAHGTLPIFDKELEIAPGATWRGFALFDVGAYTADAYDQLLAYDGKAELVLTIDGKPAAHASFRAVRVAVPALCLPGTNRASQARCEVLVQPS